MMIKKIVIDGNDGTGKTYRIEQLKKLFPGIEFQDRGIFSKSTLIEELFEPEPKGLKYLFKCTPRERFINTIKSHPDTLYIILWATPETCQKRIQERGDSIEEEYHTIADLSKFNLRFKTLVEYVKNLPNVMYICTD